jgi:hypothetical protein
VSRYLIPCAALFLLLPSCTTFLDPQLAALSKEPLSSEPRARGVGPWSFSDHSGSLISTQHYRIFTTIDDPVFSHMVIRVLEAAHDRAEALVPGASLTGSVKLNSPLDCYVFSSRGQWESYTRERAGSNAPIYLQISSGGYCQEGVFAGYDIGRQQTLSVIAHEAWHQYSWFAFKSRLPAWLEEGLATQNEAIEWSEAQPVFRPELNQSRMAALKLAWHGGKMWPLLDLLSTHAGLVIKMPQSSIDAYYAQLWSLVLFLEHSPLYSGRLQALLSDAASGKLTQSLIGTTVTQQEIDHFTEHWNTIAGPTYLQKYVNSDLTALEGEYRSWVRDFVRTGTP